MYLINGNKDGFIVKVLCTTEAEVGVVCSKLQALNHPFDVKEVSDYWDIVHIKRSIDGILDSYRQYIMDIRDESVRVSRDIAWIKSFDILSYLDHEAELHQLQARLVELQQLRTRAKMLRAIMWEVR